MVLTLPRPAEESGIITVVCNVDRAQPVTEDPIDAPAPDANPGPDPPPNPNSEPHLSPNLARPSLSNDPNGEASPPDPEAPPAQGPRFYSVHWASIMQALRILKQSNGLYGLVVLQEPDEMRCQPEQRPQQDPTTMEIEEDLHHSVALHTDPQVRP